MKFMETKFHQILPSTYCHLVVVSRSYKVLDSSQEALAIVSPTHRPNKRVKVESSPRYSERSGRLRIVCYTRVHYV